MSSKNNDTKKPSIALVVDLKGWAYWNIASKVKELLSDFYDIEIIPTEEFENNVVRLFFYTKNFDLIHVFWRGHLSLFEHFESYMNECGFEFSEFMNKYVLNKRITTSVYDHLYLDNLDFTNFIFSRCKNYSVSSNLLKDIYDKQTEIIKKPAEVITDGVDLEKFKPINLERFSDHKELVVGWVGNSAWSQQIEDFKGFNTIIKPALEELKSEGYKIEGYFADRQERMIPHEDMPEYYSKLDVCLCASKIEGTPNPVLEAMACGVPVISTNVGIVKDAFGENQKQFIIDRTIEELKSKLIKLYNDRDLLKKLSEENIDQIKDWDWKIKVRKFKEFFDANLE